MKIFVTGATGYIGQQLTAKLLDQGHVVHALCRKTPEGAMYDHPRLQVFYGDILDVRSLSAAMKGCEQVFHLAAYARPWAKRTEYFFEINVLGTVNIMETALKVGVRKMVFSSTGAVFGASNGSPVTEDMVRKVDFFTAYESSKFMAEEKIQHYVRRGLDVSIVNPFRVYGPGLWTESNAVSLMIRSYVEGNWHVIPGDGRTRGSFSFIDDVVDGHLLAMQHGRPGERYILGGTNATFNEFFDLLKRLSKKSYLLVHVPLPFMLLFGWKEEMGAKLWGKEPLITRKWIRKYNFNLDSSSDKAIQELGYQITPLQEGLIKTLQWLEEEKNIHY